MIGNFDKCLHEARGEYIKFVLQDDKLLSVSAIRRMVAALDNHPSAVMVGCRQHITGAKSKPLIFSKTSGTYGGKQMIMACLEQNSNLIGQPTLTLFRKNALKGALDSRFIGHLDYALWCELLEHGDFVYLAETLGTWRVHENQQTAKFGKTGASDHEHMLFTEVCYAKPWLREMATDRMLFAQIYYLRKQYGAAAGPLASAMMSQLSPRRYAWQWLKHKSRTQSKNSLGDSVANKPRRSNSRLNAEISGVTHGQYLVTSNDRCHSKKRCAYHVSDFDCQPFGN